MSIFGNGIVIALRSNLETLQLLLNASRAPPPRECPVKFVFLSDLNTEYMLGKYSELEISLVSQVSVKPIIVNSLLLIEE